MPTGRFSELDDREKIILEKLENLEKRILHGEKYLETYKSFNKFYEKYIKDKMSRDAFSKRLKSLERKGFIKREKHKNKTIIHLIQLPKIEGEFYEDFFENVLKEVEKEFSSVDMNNLEEIIKKIKKVYQHLFVSSFYHIIECFFMGKRTDFVKKWYTLRIVEALFKYLKKLEKLEKKYFGERITEYFKNIMKNEGINVSSLSEDEIKVYKIQWYLEELEPWVRAFNLRNGAPAGNSWQEGLIRAQEPLF